MSLKNKLRHIWQILKNGEPYGDMMVIDTDTANKLVEDISKILGDNK